MARPERRKTKKVKETIDVLELEETQRINYNDDTYEDTGFFIKEKNDGSVEVGTSDIQTIQLEFEKKLKVLEQENQRLKSEVSGLSKNEEKLLVAIKSEMINQSKDEPIIGRSTLLKKYKINSRYFDDAINGLISKSLIKRNPVKYSSKIRTYSWKILSTT
jgi:hypothetical protein